LYNKGLTSNGSIHDGQAAQVGLQTFHTGFADMIKSYSAWENDPKF